MEKPAIQATVFLIIGRETVSAHNASVDLLCSLREFVSPQTAEPKVIQDIVALFAIQDISSMDLFASHAIAIIIYQ